MIFAMVLNGCLAIILKKYLVIVIKLFNSDFKRISFLFIVYLRFSIYRIFGLWRRLKLQKSCNRFTLQWSRLHKHIGRSLKSRQSVSRRCQAGA
jgi:hypothetical protein